MTLNQRHERVLVSATEAADQIRVTGHEDRLRRRRGTALGPSRRSAVMPGDSIRATAPMSSAPHSNSRQVATIASADPRLSRSAFAILALALAVLITANVVSAAVVLGRARA